MRNAVELFHQCATVSVTPYCGFNSYQSVFGISALEWFLKKIPVSRIIELGTAEGGTAILFGLHMWITGGKFVTWDSNRRQSEKWFELAKMLGIEFVNSDIFQPESKEKIKSFIQQPGRTLLFCDNGNKPLEVNTFASLLKHDDILMAHDWGIEIKETHIKPEVRELFEFYKQEELDDLRSSILCMVRK